MLAGTVGGTFISIFNAEAAIKVLENEMKSDDADCENCAIEVFARAKFRYRDTIICCQIMFNVPKHFLPATSTKILGKVVE
jgi:hypothetical protein